MEDPGPQLMGAISPLEPRLFFPLLFSLIEKAGPNRIYPKLLTKKCTFILCTKLNQKNFLKKLLKLTLRWLFGAFYWLHTIRDLNSPQSNGDCK
jgi:hypothetical protein